MPKNPSPVVIVEKARCQVPTCASTSSKVLTTRPDEYAGTLADGRAYTHIVRRWVRCRACGQIRIEKSFENRPASYAADESSEI